MTEQELFNEYRKSNCKTFTDFLLNIIVELKEELNYAKTHCLFRSDCPTQKELAGIKLKVEALSGDIPWSELKDKSEVIGQLTKAKELLKKFVDFVNLDVEYDPENPQVHTDLWNELCAEAENFLKESEVEK